MVSEYYWAKSLGGTKGVRHNDPKHFNEWVQRQLRQVKKSGHCYKGHCIPSNRYTHDKGKQLVNHILKLENIAELPALLTRYGLERIEVDHGLVRARTADDLLDARNFTKETLCIVNSWAKLDFYYYGYEKIVPSGKNSSLC